MGIPARIRVIESPSDAADLASHILNPQRRSPIVVVCMRPGHAPALDIDDLAR